MEEGRTWLGSICWIWHNLYISSYECPARVAAAKEFLHLIASQFACLAQYGNSRLVVELFGVR